METIVQTQTKTKTTFKCDCGKEYKQKASFSTHRTKCSSNNKPEPEPETNQQEQETPTFNVYTINYPSGPREPKKPLEMDADMDKLKAEMQDIVKDTIFRYNKQKNEFNFFNNVVKKNNLCDESYELDENDPSYFDNVEECVRCIDEDDSLNPREKHITKFTLAFIADMAEKYDELADMNKVLQCQNDIYKNIITTLVDKMSANASK
jgi:hypothetical protein